MWLGRTIQFPEPTQLSAETTCLFSLQCVSGSGLSSGSKGGRSSLPWFSSAGRAESGWNQRWARCGLKPDRSPKNPPPAARQKVTSARCCAMCPEHLSCFSSLLSSFIFLIFPLPFFPFLSSFFFLPFFPLSSFLFSFFPSFLFFFL